MSNRVKIFSKYSNPRQLMEQQEATAELAKRFGAVQDEAPHGLAPTQIEQMHAKWDAMRRKGEEQAGSTWGTVFRGGNNRSQLFAEALPPGRQPAVRTAQMTGGPGMGSGGPNGSNTLLSPQQNYLPEFASPDRQSMPVHRRIANVYWRLFNKVDPIIGPVIEMFSMLPWSDFQITGEGVDGEIKDTLEYMINEVKLRSLLPQMVSEFMTIGECIPHLNFKNDKGIWDYCALHNPDYVNVVYSPFIKMDTIMEFVPDPKLRELVTSDNPMLARVRETMPPELVSKLRAGQTIQLNPVNSSFIARKLHPYDLRGTSVISRLWRVLYFEDAVFSASLATARRAACFVAGTPVLTPDGIKPIETIAAGEKIIAGDGSAQLVEASWAEMPDGNGLTEIKVLGTSPIFCTPQHRFKVWVAPRNCACGCGKPIGATYDTGRVKRRAFISGHHLNLMRDKKTGQMGKGLKLEWKTYCEQPALRAPVGYQPLQKLEAKDIRVGDYLVVPRKFEEKKTSTTKEAARLLGYFAAEGSKRDLWNGWDKENPYITCEGVAFSFSLAEYDTWAQDVKICAKTLDVDVTIDRYVPPPETKMAQSGREGRTTVYIQKRKDEHFSLWLREHAKIGANHHVLSEEVMSWPLSLKEELVRGYFRGDGHFGIIQNEVSSCPQVTACSTSKTLAYQVRLILAQMGFFASMYYQERGDRPGEENWHDTWAVSCTGRDARGLAKLIWGIDVEMPSYEASRAWSDDEYVYAPVTEVLHHDEDVTTYNLSVTGDHSYLVEGIQTFNSPVKLLKIGDPATGTIPPASEEKRVLQLMAQAELDPQAWVCYNYMISGELLGAPERLMSINTHYDLIERIKLSGLGVSKSFLQGDGQYASAAAGLTIFLQRLKAIRDFFVNEWLIPKFFLPVAVINGWVKPNKFQASQGHVRVKQSALDEMDEKKFIIPTLEWSKSLDSAIDKERIDAMVALETNLGIKFTDQKKFACLGLDNEEQQKGLISELKFKRDIAGKDPQSQALLGLAGPPQEGGGGAGGGMGTTMPGIPPEAMGMPGEGDEGGGAPTPSGDDGSTALGIDTPAPEGASIEGAEGAEPKKPKKPVEQESKHWSKESLDPLLHLFDSFDINVIKDADQEPWVFALKDPEFVKAIKSEDPTELWMAVEQFLISEDFPSGVIKDLECQLVSKGKVKTAELFRSVDQTFDKLSAELGVDADESIDFLVGSTD